MWDISSMESGGSGIPLVGQGPGVWGPTAVGCGGGSQCNEVWELWGFGVWGPTDGILLPPPRLSGQSAVSWSTWKQLLRAGGAQRGVRNQRGGEKMGGGGVCMRWGQKLGGYRGRELGGSGWKNGICGGEKRGGGVLWGGKWGGGERMGVNGGGGTRRDGGLGPPPHPPSAASPGVGAPSEAAVGGPGGLGAAVSWAVTSLTARLMGGTEGGTPPGPPVETPADTPTETSAETPVETPTAPPQGERPLNPN